MSRRSHGAPRCDRCGRCTCTPCRRARAREPWRAPAGGGYHGCPAAPLRGTSTAPPPAPPVSVTVEHPRGSVLVEVLVALAAAGLIAWLALVLA